MPDFELFHHTEPARVAGPAVTITPRGQLIVNRTAAELLDPYLTRPAAVELLYDRQAAIIGIRPTRDVGSRSAFLLHVLRDGGSRSIDARRFLEHCGISVVGAARTYPAGMDDGILCVDVSRPGVPTSEHEEVR